MTPKQFIFVAEDESDTANLIEYHLKRRGFRTAVAPDGLTALNDIVESKPDLIILDLVLPQLHGLEVCRLVKSSPMIRQVMLTCPADARDRRSRKDRSIAAGIGHMQRVFHDELDERFAKFTNFIKDDRIWLKKVKLEAKSD